MDIGHDFIQLIFPTKRPSKYSNRDYVLTDEMKNILTSDHHKDELRNYFKTVLHDKYLPFLGIKVHYVDSNDDKFSEAYFELKDTKAANTFWRGQNFDHNQRRLTRVLNCLNELGYTDHAINLRDFLNDEKSLSPGITSLQKYWNNSLYVGF